MSAPLPTPSERYDRTNEAATRRALEQIIAQQEERIRQLEARVAALEAP